MHIINNIEDFNCSQKTVATTGTFDGVHKGHQSIILRMNKVAQSIGGRSVLVTFDPHPRLVVNPEKTNLRFLNSMDEKLILLEKLGLDCILILPFTSEFAKVSYSDYIKDFIVDKMRTKKVVVGYNHNFGSGRFGDFALLKEIGEKYSFDTEEIPALFIDGSPVSSTRIRKALNAGLIDQANNLLGYTYSICGKVIHGEKLGRRLGFPTANIEPNDPMKLIPARGVYAVTVLHKGTRYNGMCNIGVKPTFINKPPGIEVNIFDFDQEIYGDELSVHFLRKTRNEEKFSSMKELIARLEKDKMEISGLINTVNFADNDSPLL